MQESFKGADGKFYNLSSLTLGDFRKFSLWVQYKPYSELQAVKELLPPEVYAEQSKEILRECAKHPFTESSPEVEAARSTLEGVCYFIYLSCKRNHPLLTEDTMSDILTIQNAREVGDLLAALNGLGDDTEKKRRRF